MRSRLRRTRVLIPVATPVGLVVVPVVLVQTSLLVFSFGYELREVRVQLARRRAALRRADHTRRGGATRARDGGRSSTRASCGTQPSSRQASSCTAAARPVPEYALTSLEGSGVEGICGDRGPRGRACVGRTVCQRDFGWTERARHRRRSRDRKNCDLGCRPGNGAAPRRLGAFVQALRTGKQR
jgi:hypothetical protein